MNNNDKKYLELVSNTTIKGQYIEDRTGAGRLNLTHSSLEFDMQEGFPLIQVKKTPFKMVVKELLWFIQGNCNIKRLVDQKVNIWNDDAYNYYSRLHEEPLSKDTFLKNLGVSELGYTLGDLGNVYGKYWKDQLPKVVESIKNNPFSARHRVDCWYPEEQKTLDCALPPCHYGFQFVCGSYNELSLVFNMRSTDTFLGLPFNIASYGLLLEMVAKLTKRVPDKLVFQGTNTHVYANHVDSVALMIKNSEETVGSSPKVKIKGDQKTIFDFKLEDFFIENYHSNEYIFAPLNT
jgi:thymidylate synthase